MYENVLAYKLFANDFNWMQVNISSVNFISLYQSWEDKYNFIQYLEHGNSN